MDDSVPFNDLGPSKPPSASFYDDMFESYFNRAAEAPEPAPKASSSPSTPPPVFDKPVFDDDPYTADPFDAIPLFGGGGGGEEEDLHGGVRSAAKTERTELEVVGFDEDLFPGLAGSTNFPMEKPAREVERDRQPVGFDDELIPGFDGSMKPAPQMEPETVAFDDDVIPDCSGGTSYPSSARSESPLIQNAIELFIFVAYLIYYLKKNLTCGGKTAPGHCIKKKTFSHRSRKPPNPGPTHTQRHRSPCENDHDRG
jgi:hypothetical protein